MFITCDKINKQSPSTRLLKDFSLLYFYLLTEDTFQMLHELLIALRGHPGYIYTDQDQKLRVNSSLTFLHPCEVSAK